jgi:hypothetical protein
MEKIDFKSVIDACNKFIESNGKDSSLVDIESKLIIRNYLDMDAKAICLVRAFLDADKDVSVPSVFVSIAMDLALLFDCLLAYTNIDIDAIESGDKIYENYDSIYKAGLADYIMEYCEKDYNRLVKMADRMLSIEHVSSLLMGIENIDGDAIDELTRSIVDLKNNGDKEMIRDMATIAKASDPDFESIKEKLSEETLDKIFSEK